MSHEITTRDGVFAVRSAMWHGLGTVLPDYPTRDEAQQLVHPWEPDTEPLYRRYEEPVGVGEDGQIQTAVRYEQIESSVLVTRSDDRGEIGAVSPTYQLVSNSTMYDIAEAIEGIDKGSVLYETGGSLAGGRRVWLMLRLRKPIVVKGDPNGTIVPFFALQNSHDGSGSFRGQAVADRIVCANTSRMADFFARAHRTEFVFSHTKNVAEKIEEAKAALAGWRVMNEQFEEQANHLMTLKVSDVQVSRFVTRFIPMPLASTATPRVEANVWESREIYRQFLSSATCEGINDRAWGLVQASVEYLNYGRKAHSAETRFRRSMLDRQEMVTKAVHLASEVAAYA